MTRKLEPMFNYTEDCIVGGGRYAAQLEIPKGSSLSDNDIERILRVAGWEEDEMEHMVDGFEGGRAVLLGKDKISYNNGMALKALQVSGVGYLELERLEGKRALFSPKGKMKPPDTENFYDYIDLMGEEGGSTTGFRNGVIEFERPEYAPRGSYLESRAKEKINKTRKARNLNLKRMTVPKIEAYGRYLDLKHNDEHLSFMVFPVPSVSGRFAESFLKSFEGSFDGFATYMGTLADRVGRAVRELHNKGKCHRQLHFSNFYYIPESGRLYVMDWGTMMDLKGIDADKRAIDIRIPHQNLEHLQELMFGRIRNLSDGDFMIGMNSISFLQETLGSYFGREIDLMKLYDQIRMETGIEDDAESIVEIIKRELSGVKSKRRIGRNDPCSCGSGMKFKRCCGR